MALILHACLLLALPAVGGVALPDPLWIQGLYDDADLDLLCLLSDAELAVQAPARHSFVRPVRAARAPREVPDPSTIARSALRPRSPPTA